MSTECVQVDGSVSIGCGSGCRFLCCLTPSQVGNSPQMQLLQHQMESIDKKLDRLERRCDDCINLLKKSVIEIMEELLIQSVMRIDGQMIVRCYMTTTRNKKKNKKKKQKFVL